MSTKYLTQAQALSKIDSSGGNTDFVKKSYLVSNGNFDTTKLTNYGNNDFVIDDDIVKKSGGSTTDPEPEQPDLWRKCTLSFEGNGKLACNIIFTYAEKSTVSTMIRYDLDHPLEFDVQFGAKIEFTIENNFSDNHKITNIWGNVASNYFDTSNGSTGTLDFSYMDDASYQIIITIT